ncbi:MAG: prepilin-type N-terminal cleavage/methylation domain-containing protein [Desulfobulbaceae bacterium]|nr:prepilin-type N-terminal cleavage/methylation domain-containing protein [Desulfobulbaceae bacterium]
MRLKVVAGHRTDGFTLLEVMVAVAIIAIALTTLFGSQTQSAALVGEARFYTTAPLLAQEKMTELLAAGLADATNDSGAFGDDFPGYRWRVEPRSVAGATPEVAALLRGVDVVVSWGEPERYRYVLTRFGFDAGG